MTLLEETVFDGFSDVDVDEDEDEDVCEDEDEDGGECEYYDESIYQEQDSDSESEGPEVSNKPLTIVANKLLLRIWIFL